MFNSKKHCEKPNARIQYFVICIALLVQPVAIQGLQGK